MYSILIEVINVDREFPILEHHDKIPAVIEPSKVLKPIKGLPEKAILVFYGGVIEKLLEENRLIHVQTLKSIVADFNIYKMKIKGEEIVVFNPGLGAPCAAGYFDELIAYGVKKTVAVGSAGVLDKNLKRGTIILVDSAVRHEGTSYHYLKPSREVKANEDILKDMEKTLKSLNAPYIKGKTWTTDAFYRETEEMVKKRVNEGCLTVEMEASALMAVAKFRNIPFGQILSAGDDVSGNEWDIRFHPETKNFREKIFWVAVDCLLNL